MKRVRAIIFSFLAFSVVATTTVWGEQSQRVLSSDSLMSFLMAGISEARMIRLVRERGISFRVSDDCVKKLQFAGAPTNLITELRAQRVNAHATSTCSAELARVAKLARGGDFRTAEKDIRAVMMRSSNEDGSLQFALGVILSRQEQWDAASDVLTNAATRMPGSPEVHSQLAYVFYRTDDGDNAIAEARTALSMDPQNAEAYRLLGLGLYSNGKYLGAMNAFEQSLTREPNNSDVYYDMK